MTLATTPFAFCVVLLLLVPSTASADQIIIRCFGYNRALSGTIEHDVVINGTSAIVDSLPYSLKVTPTYYSLEPITNRVLGLLTIDRIDGSYRFTTYGSATSAPDWSRPQDQGCAVVKPKL